MYRRSWPLVLALTVAPLVASAQARFEIGPVFGYYRPYGSFDQGTVALTSLPSEPRDLQGAAWGLESRLWLGHRVGLEVRGSVAASTLPYVVTPAFGGGRSSAAVSALTTQLLLGVAGSERYQAWIGAGAGVTHHGGKAYDSLRSLTDVGPAASAGARLRLFRHLQLTGGVSVLAYTLDVPMPAQLAQNPGSLQRGRQVDALFDVGLSWAIGPGTR